MLQKNKRKICYISVPVAPPESFSKHCLWRFEVLTFIAKNLVIIMIIIMIIQHLFSMHAHRDTTGTPGHRCCEILPSVPEPGPEPR